MSELPRLRARIEELDDQLADLLALRAEVVAELWALKDARGIPRFDPDREQAELERVVARAVALGLDPDAVRRVLATVVGQPLR